MILYCLHIERFRDSLILICIHLCTETATTVSPLTSKQPPLSPDTIKTSLDSTTLETPAPLHASYIAVGITVQILIVVGGVSLVVILWKR